MASHYPANFDDYRYCSSGDTYLVVEEQDSTCSCLNLTVLLPLETWRESKWHVILANPILVTRNG